MSESLQLAKYYFDLSNQGNLADIRKLFTASSTYSSANTGFYLGVDQIMKMQEEFFAGYEAVAWEVHRVEEVKPSIVFFDFTFSGKALNAANFIRRGHEHVIVYDSKIQHIDVRSLDRTENQT